MIQQIADFCILYAEHFVTLVLAVCVFLAARNNIWNWPIGLVGVTMYGLSAWFLWGLYADALLQIFYFCTGIIGWIFWAKGGKGRTNAPVRDFSMVTKFALFFGIFAIGGFLGDYMSKTTDSVVPYLDAITTVMCFVANILLMTRVRFNWILWIVADIMYVYMFHVKGLNLLAVEYAVFTLNAVMGYVVWTKAMKKGE